jgi:predicted metal-dependent phosphoesterase TrpH
MKVDLHIHTDHSSDSRNKVADIVRLLKEKGIKGAAFVDHNSPEGGREALSLGLKDFHVIPGIEVSSAEGHILALNVTEPIERDMGVRETIEKIHELGGVAIAAHPYRKWSGLGEDNVIGHPFDGIEAINGRSSARSNRHAKALARDLGLAVTAGSDSHENDTLGSAYTIFPDDCDNVEDLMKAILDRRTKVEGNGRSPSQTMHYVIKSVSEYVGRGMHRM